MRHLHSRKGSWSRTYYSWAAMVQRCVNPARNNWQNYGGRGITVCDRWLVFANFLADMGERPAGTSIEREDTDKGYAPGNCTWASCTAQNRNRRNSKLCVADVERIRDLRANKVSWARIGAHFGVSKTLIYHIEIGKTWRMA